MQIDFVVTEEEAAKLLDVVERAGVRVFYVKMPVIFGVTNPDATDAPEFRRHR